MIVLVVYLSLTSTPVRLDTGLPYQDKLMHLLAYFALAFWFMQLYHVRRHMLRWFVFFLLLGLLMEYLQGFDARRYSEAGDMIANATGVVLAAALSRTRLRFTLARFEQLIQ